MRLAVKREPKKRNGKSDLYFQSNPMWDGFFVTHHPVYLDSLLIASYDKKSVIFAFNAYFDLSNEPIPQNTT